MDCCSHYLSFLVLRDIMEDILRFLEHQVRERQLYLSEALFVYFSGFLQTKTNQTSCIVARKLLSPAPYPSKLSINELKYDL